MEAFSELVDPAHFEQVYDSVEEAEKFLKHLAVLPIDKCQHRMLAE